MAAEPIDLHSPPGDTLTHRSAARPPRAPFPLVPDPDAARGSSEFFCSNPVCVFHVRVGDPDVRGFGDWASTEAGVTVSHRWINGQLVCDLCAARATGTRPGTSTR